MTQAAMTGAVRKTPAASRLTRQRARAAWLFLAPSLLVLILVAAWPLLRTFAYGFTDANLADPGAAAFIGFENYRFLLTDPLWWRSVWNTVFFTVVAVSLEMVIGTIIALALNAAVPWRGGLRAAVLIPWVIPTVVAAQMWGWMYHDIHGVLNEILVGLGLIEAKLAWTADPDLAIWAVIFTDVWKTTPFVALLVLAGLQMVPRDILEAAKMDGVSGFKLFFGVILPLIRSAVLVAALFRILDSLRIFDVIYVLTGNNERTMSMSVYARQQLVDFQDVGFGSAATSLLFGIVALVSVVYLMLGRLELMRED